MPVTTVIFSRKFFQATENSLSRADFRTPKFSCPVNEQISAQDFCNSWQ
jgi:hypothetical protein